MLRSLFQLLHRLAPRRNHAVVYGWPDAEDQGRSLLDALRNTPVDRVILLASHPSSCRWTPQVGATCVSKNSIKGILSFLTARYVFFTHPCFVRDFPADVVSVNLWHGMPVKKIGAMIENDPPIRCSHTLATSPFWADIMKQTIMAPGGEILHSGLPRNDRLFTEPAGIMDKLGLSHGGKLLVWLPTYRSSIRGLPRTDGCDYGNALGLPDADPEALNTLLRTHDATLMVKPHPMAPVPDAGQWSHLKFISDDWLARQSVTLYELLAASSLLISDISSVYIDYLLVDRPIIHAFPDLHEYRKSRGFTVEPVEDFLAGPLVTTFDELLDALRGQLDGDDTHAATRRKLLPLFHQHTDNRSTERLIKAIGLA